MDLPRNHREIAVDASFGDRGWQIILDVVLSIKIKWPSVVKTNATSFIEVFEISFSEWFRLLFWILGIVPKARDMTPDPEVNGLSVRNKIDSELVSSIATCHEAI